MVKNPSTSAGDVKDMGTIIGLGRFLGGGSSKTLSSILGESHGQRSLVGHSPWGRRESDMTEAT